MATVEKIVTASMNTALDKLLEELCESVQLTATQFKDAEDHYHTVTPSASGSLTRRVPSPAIVRGFVRRVRPG
jgi:hypothetical protein